ncbi:hypothetical protein ES288_A09G006500v1 [Gossypium darwinii]|uniref:Uncharacterized protein n=1 Tax=Gossypium darwinii TaxID=34276 RepID=A0A5D2F6E6_GOSDA|nr:hypothetical protein ES288_A09G006500v1 [Gossypium darwinii]
MPDSDPGRTYIWTISGILFLCVTIGGGCLLVYITSPQSQSSQSLPIVGLVLVCMPWIFWILTILYRITSRAFGFRMVTGNLYGDLDSGGGAAGSGSNDIDVNAKDAPIAPSNDEAKNGQERNTKRDGRPSSTSSNDVSITSHESEIPLSLSKAL